MNQLNDYMLNPPDAIYPHCPVCGSECEHVYRENFTDNILGCENCISEEDAWETEACFPDE